MTIAIDQNWNIGPTNGSYVDATTHTGSATASGALLIAILSGSSSGAIDSVSDSSGANTWVPLAATDSLRAYYALAAAPVTSVTVTKTGDVSRKHLGVFSFVSDDVLSITDSDALLDASNTTWSPLVVTPAAAGDYIIGAMRLGSTSRVFSAASPFTQIASKEQTQEIIVVSASAPNTSNIGPTWTITSGSAAAPHLLTLAITETPAGPDPVSVLPDVTDNLALITAVGSNGTPPYTYTIDQTSGATTTPTEISDDSWLVAKHATDTLVYDVTVTDDNDVEDTSPVEVPPLPNGNMGPLSPVGPFPSTTWV